MTGVPYSLSKIFVEQKPDVAISDDYNYYLIEFKQTLLHTHEPVTRLTFEQIFLSHYRKWINEVRYESSTTRIVMNHNYQQIIGLGPEVVPLIIQQLKEKPNYWFWALETITGENPVSPIQRGNIREMRNAWLEWGRRKDYI